MNAVAAYMVSMLTVVQGRFEDRKDRGATAVEYGLLVGLIAVVLITVIGLLGTRIQGMFQSIADALAPGA